MADDNFDQSHSIQVEHLLQRDKLLRQRPLVIDCQDAWCLTETKSPTNQQIDKNYIHTYVYSYVHQLLTFKYMYCIYINGRHNKNAKTKRWHSLKVLKHK